LPRPYREPSSKALQFVVRDFVQLEHELDARHFEQVRRNVITKIFGRSDQIVGASDEVRALIVLIRHAHSLPLMSVAPSAHRRSITFSFTQPF
jgi:hypothetical protein